jgi:hypothetical protein
MLRWCPVRLPWTRDFDDERERFSLRYSCEDCGNWNPADERCRHEWPNERHRLEKLQPDREWVDFCKEFELC